ncbi:MAG: hypothetical protein M1833_007265 [Piccolia ochrophora]|nr:MAG: hypothetical protein M1833_007265 [Piccolia ochrophora]
MDIMGHRRVQNELDKVASIVAPNEEHKQAIQELGAFTGHLTKSFSTQNLADNFKLLQPLRSWLLWSPIRFLTPHHPDGSALVVLAHLYAVALAVEPWFSAVGAAYFGSMSVGPIEDIMETLNGLRASRRFNDDLQTLSDLMGFPLQMSFSFRDRMGWTQPNLDAEQTFSLPRSPFEGTLANLDLGPDSPGTDLIAEELHITYSQGSEWLITNSPPATPRPNASMRNRDSRSLDSHFPANISEVDASTFPGYEIVGGAPRYVEEEQGMCPYAMAAGLTGGFVPSALWT